MNKLSLIGCYVLYILIFTTAHICKEEADVTSSMTYYCRVYLSVVDAYLLGISIVYWDEQ